MHISSRWKRKGAAQYMKTEKRRAFLINAGYYILFVAAGVLLLKYALPLLMPFVLSFVFAYFLMRPVNFLKQMLKVRGKLPAIIVVTVFAVHCVIAILGPSSAATRSKVFSRVIKYLMKVRKRGTADLSSSFAL